MMPAVKSLKYLCDQGAVWGWWEPGSARGSGSLLVEGIFRPIVGVGNLQMSALQNTENWLDMSNSRLPDWTCGTMSSTCASICACVCIVAGWVVACCGGAVYETSLQTCAVRLCQHSTAWATTDHHQPRSQLDPRTHAHACGPLSRITWVSRYQKGKTNPDFTEARDSEWRQSTEGTEQVKACVVLTCTNGVSPNHLPLIVASDRPWTTLSTRTH